ncbi:two-component sensor histidine kinase [Corallococcus praedator]|uniref:histidine kinase n=1 Tax=Corallococcus praedator TaxID=2316724 RepID=A0ABX9QD28_9BACT|nr:MULTISPECIES: ATP-binding protein [Corallococcus]RKH26504.1 two-component sensor histidine kinase [Corallococcus sp. CA031C]RKH99042.1 two-component sensor histidine kinase [Corallococcus praedator]
MSASSSHASARVSQCLEGRAEALLARHLRDSRVRVDALFTWLMLGQWASAILVAVFFSPYGWEGRVRGVHVHVQTAVLLGAALSLFPVLLTRLRPGEAVTRHVVAVNQMLWSALLIHLTGGRIETHFHIFGSLAVLSFYRDPKVLLTASFAIVVDHCLRGALWPESIYGQLHPEWWRFLEHAFWVAVIDAVLFVACRDAVRELREKAKHQAHAEQTSERELAARAGQLDAAVREVLAFRDHADRLERLASLGQLTASVGHELRNPLAAARTAHAFVLRRMLKIDAVTTDPRIPRFLDIIDRELQACTVIISDLLDYARGRPPSFMPCPLKPLVEEAISVVPVREGVRVNNQVPDGLPVPHLDREQFRQVLVNLIQNAVEAIPPERSGEVCVHADALGDGGWSLRVTDDGPGIPAPLLERIFEPMFTTKLRGTGLGLAIVKTLVQGHGARIQAESDFGHGSRFTVLFPDARVPDVAVPAHP